MKQDHGDDKFMDILIGASAISATNLPNNSGSVSTMEKEMVNKYSPLLNSEKLLQKKNLILLLI